MWFDCELTNYIFIVYVSESWLDEKYEAQNEWRKMHGKVLQSHCGIVGTYKGWIIKDGGGI